jgi:hypothetical protein
MTQKGWTGMLKAALLENRVTRRWRELRNKRVGFRMKMTSFSLYSMVLDIGK